MTQAQEPQRNLDARAQAFLKRIAPLSADLAAHGRTRTLALKKLRRICHAEARRLKANYTTATVTFYLSKYRDSIRAVEPDHLVLRPRKMRSGQRFSYLALEPEETRALNEAYHQRIHRDQSNLIPLDPEAFVQKALALLASDRYLEKGMGLMALTGRRPAEIFFSAKFSLPRKKLPYPAVIFDGQLKTRQAPGTSFEPYSIPVLADPQKRSSVPSTRSDHSRVFLPRMLSTPPPALSSLSTFLPPSVLWTNPGNQATCAQPTAPSVATSSNPRTLPMISSWPRSSAINSSDLTHPSPSGRVIRISMSKVSCFLITKSPIIGRSSGSNGTEKAVKLRHR